MKETFVTYKLWDGCKAPQNLEFGNHLVGQRVRTVAVDLDAMIALSKGMLDAFRVGAVSGEGIDRAWCRELHDEYARRMGEAFGKEAQGEA